MNPSYLFSLALPVALQISALALTTVLPLEKLLHDKSAITHALDNALFTALFFPFASLPIILLAIPFGIMQLKCARIMARENITIPTQLFVGSLNFSISILLIATILTIHFWLAPR